MSAFRLRNLQVNYLNDLNLLLLCSTSNCIIDGASIIRTRACRIYLDRGSRCIQGLGADQGGLPSSL